MSFTTAKTLNDFIGKSIFKTKTNDGQSGRCSISQVGIGGDAETTRSSFQRYGRDGLCFCNQKSGARGRRSVYVKKFKL